MKATQTKNLDVAGTSQDPESGCTKSVSGELAHVLLLSSLGAYTAQPDQHRHRWQYRTGGTRYITIPQAANIIEAVDFAKSIGHPLVAHLTIHWAYTDVGDDPDGKLFAKVREGLDKWLRRQRIVFAAAWSRERMSGGQAEVVHCHLLFYLPVEYCTKRKLQVEAAIFRLIKRHGRGCWADEVIKLAIWTNPDGKYLIKGGGPKVWKLFRLRKEHRRLQGLIHGKRCGTTQNIGRAARNQSLLIQREKQRSDPLRAGRMMLTARLHPIKPKKGGEIYSVIFRGELLVVRSGDPECDAARALLAKGITGKLTMLDGKTGRPRTVIDIERAAMLCVKEGPLRFAPNENRPDRSQTAGTDEGEGKARVAKCLASTSLGTRGGVARRR